MLNVDGQMLYFSCRLGRAISLTTILLALVSTFGCGQRVDEVEVKNFRLTLVGPDQSLVQTIKKLIDQYNAGVGIQSLRYVEHEEEANSPIILTKGLNARDGKVGWGQAIAEIEENNTADGLSGVKVDRTVRHAMRVEFDEEYIRERSVATATAEQKYDLQKLFSHEVGHGMEMLHDEKNPENVMFPDIGGQKDFEAYYAYIRSYFSQ